MAYYGSRLSFGHHRNLSSVTIPNNVLVGEDGDFSGRFSVMMNYNYRYTNKYNSESGKYDKQEINGIYILKMILNNIYLIILIHIIIHLIDLIHL